MSMFHELMMKKKSMPSRYQEVEYIESTGTQYIDTGVSKEINVNCELIVQSNDISGNKIIFGAESSGGQWIGTSNTYYSVGGGNNFSFSSTTKQTINFNIKYHNSISATIDMETKSRTYSSAGTDIFNSYRIFGLAGNNFSSCKIFQCTIKTESNTIIKNFIPVYDTITQKYGMWESVQGKFYGNAGTGDFAGSIVGYTVVGSPMDKNRRKTLV